MIKQLKQTNNIEEANELLDKGWVLLSSNNNTFILGAKEEICEKEKNSILQLIGEKLTGVKK